MECHISIFIRGSVYDDLVISAGQYFPLNLADYYLTFKEHAEVWIVKSLDLILCIIY